MKRLLLLSLLALPLLAWAQKRPLDHSVYDSWESVATPYISPNGNVIGYAVNPQEGDGRLVLRAFGNELTVPRGYRLSVTPDERYALCLVKPLFQQTRQAKIKKKKDLDMPHDTLLVIHLSDMSVKRIPHVSSYTIGKKATDAIAFLSADTALIPKKERSNKDIGRPCIVYHLDNGEQDTLRHVKEYAFDKSGYTLSFTQQLKKQKFTAGLFDLKRRRTQMLTDTVPFVSRPNFDDNGAQILYVMSTDTVASGSKRAALYYATTHTYALADKYGKNKGKGKADKELLYSFTQPRCLVTTNDTLTFPAGWSLNQYTTPSFSHDGKRIFAGIAPVIPPNDTTLVPFETAGLDLWRWDDPETPTMQNNNVQRELKRTYTAVYDRKSGRLTPLSTEKYESISLLSRGNADYAIVSDRSKTAIESQWDEHIPVQLSLVNLSNGQRTPITQARISNTTTSPEGRFVAWYSFDDSQWHLYEVATGKLRQLTDKTMGVNFWDEQYDCPQEPFPYGIAGWTEDDNDIIVYDRYDLWRIPTKAGGKPLRLTQGRQQKRTYRYINLKKDDAARFIAKDETLLLSVFDNTTKENGIASLPLQHPDKGKLLAFGGYTYAQPQKAEKAEQYLFTRGNFQEPMDLYHAGADLSRPERLTAINPQQKDYNWGTAELYHWTAYDGTQLDGILYKPEDFDPAKKYPVMIYFYERNSETLYNYVMPQPSWSTINKTFYTSRGYIVFVPDIVYPLDGMPGEAAYNCIVSGAESLKQYPWIDADRMAIQGQSWGGYQVAYLITRTNMFRAAGAGAPVSNMTSAYGGIRWESGMSRQFQSEHTQSRIGKTLWEAPDLYLKNSCLFTLPNVQTPVLIMHNDKDGAVPWYQGIEMFMGLKRLQKPAWMLQYNGEAHNLKERRNRKDLTIRMQQFFDHYLKDAPMPAWMKSGIPATRKGQYFGLEE